MEITLNITEDSQVELVKDSCEAVQGEKNVTILNINFPSTIKGYSIDNYAKQIEFCECKEIGECVKFLDVVEGNTYKLCDICTQFKKILIQFTLKNIVDEAEPIIWKTVPFALEFCESINAENTKEVQIALLSLAEIKADWQNYIKAHTLRMVYKVEDVPTADAASLGETIFYLGTNVTDPYTLTYGHYYRCNFVQGVYEWTDLTQDPSLEGVANGVREINKNQTMQVWLGTAKELEDEAMQDNVIYIPEDVEAAETFDEVLEEMKEDCGVLYAKKDDKEIFKNGNIIIPSFKVLWEGNTTIATSQSQVFELNENLNAGEMILIQWTGMTSPVYNSPFTTIANLPYVGYNIETCINSLYGGTTQNVFVATFNYFNQITISVKTTTSVRVTRILKVVGLEMPNF